ncbi:MAG: hypothetical protein K0R51_240 [Cytophagaceae bacterium]|jgi:hypothetical protein|nr:hypothetical protein [Cytophagaceae bacterium]
MKLSETLLLGASAAFLLIGIHQGINYGLQNSYFFLMVSVGLFLWYTLRKKKEELEAKSKNKKPIVPKSKSRNK